MTDGAATAHLYRPKLLTILTEGYSRGVFRRDLAAGLTVAIVALPLSMAIAVASGVSPERGLYAAIIGGALVSALGGSRFQIGGPAGAFIVLVAGAVADFGVDKLLLTIFVSGVMLVFLGLTRIGGLIRHIPHAVTVGFTSGIAVTILASQLKDLAGITLPAPEPGRAIPKLAALWRAVDTLTPAALGLGLGAAALIFAVQRFRPHWPGMLIAIVGASAAAVLLHLPVETIGGRFGQLPPGLPLPHLPVFDAVSILQILPAALAFTMLGGIESLLSAKVADSMTGRRHRSNMELVAQGIANMASALFGGISVTGTIARTATNIRAGARSPVSGILHAGFLLLFLLAGTRLAAYIPLSSLAGLLIVVCWNMADRPEFTRLLRERRSAVVLVATFGLTFAVDLTAGIAGGCLVAAGLKIGSRAAGQKES